MGGTSVNLEGHEIAQIKNTETAGITSDSQRVILPLWVEVNGEIGSQTICAEPQRHHHELRQARLLWLWGAAEFERNLIRERTQAGLAAAQPREHKDRRPKAQRILLLKKEMTGQASMYL